MELLNKRRTTDIAIHFVSYHIIPVNTSLHLDY